MAELMLIVPALLLLLTLIASFFSTIVLQVRCREVATSIARAIERGEPESSWEDLADHALPGAQISLHNDGSITIIEVAHRSPMLMRVEGEAVAVRPSP